MWKGTVGDGWEARLSSLECLVPAHCSPSASSPIGLAESGVQTQQQSQGTQTMCHARPAYPPPTLQVPQVWNEWQE